MVDLHHIIQEIKKYLMCKNIVRFNARLNTPIISAVELREIYVIRLSIISPKQIIFQIKYFNKRLYEHNKGNKNCYNIKFLYS